jgi:hypothetical protein
VGRKKWVKQEVELHRVFVHVATYSQALAEILMEKRFIGQYVIHAKEEEEELKRIIVKTVVL